MHAYVIMLTCCAATPHIHTRYLEENVGALAVQLTPQELQELEQAFPHDKVRHARC